MHTYLRRLLYSIFVLIATISVTAQQKVRLSAKSVTLEIYKADNVNSTTVPHGVSVIVCPGGSYCWHDYDTEGTMVAEWLQHNGITAFVLNYRVQGVFDYIMHTRYIIRGNRHPDPLNDAEEALQWVRSHADSLCIDPARVGIMGFSAGGHLAMSAAEFLTPKPAFTAPIYPVVTMTESVTHKRSRRALLGEYGKRRKVMRDSLSLERHVPNDCPPVFLVNCKDDPVVKYQNSELLDSALTAKGIAHRYIQYQTGGHGFGASDVKGTAECRQWRSEFLCWLSALWQE